VALAWFSPDCTHFTAGPGGKPFRDKKSKRSRGLVGCDAVGAAVRPRVIILENVEEFEDWGPLGDDGRPTRAAGAHFRAGGGAGELRLPVEMRELRACDYGAPTTRKRLFVVARCDGQAIVWPEPTHGEGRAALPHRRRVHRLVAALPVDLRTLASRSRRRHCGPHRARHPALRDRGGVPVHRSDGRGPLASPTLIQTGYGERPGQAPRVPGLDKPLGTMVAGGVKHALVDRVPGEALRRPRARQVRRCPSRWILSRRRTITPWSASVCGRPS
jgi:DNA (cytosine-5)-methyltransferase 1